MPRTSSFRSLKGSADYISMLMMLCHQKGPRSRKWNYFRQSECDVLREIRLASLASLTQNVFSLAEVTFKE